jgi:hypothetical protein
MPAATQAMTELIDRLNSMLAGLAASVPFVRHVDLRGTIAAHFQPADAGWSDDLHPINAMFDAMAAKIDAAI